MPPDEDAGTRPSGELKLGTWGLVINIVAFLWSVFEFVNIAWPRAYAVAPERTVVAALGRSTGAGGILGITGLYILMSRVRKKQVSKYIEQL